MHLESGDHKYTRVLSATSVEENQHHDQSQKNPIREVTDTTNEEKEIGEDTIDADDKADQLSDNASQNMVFETCPFTLNFRAVGWIVNVMIIAASHLWKKPLIRKIKWVVCAGLPSCFCLGINYMYALLLLLLFVSLINEHKMNLILKKLLCGVLAIIRRNFKGQNLKVPLHLYVSLK